MHWIITRKKVDVYSPAFFTQTFLGYIAIAIPVGIISGVANLLRWWPMQVNGEFVYGIGPALFFPLFYVMLSAMSAFMNWVLVMVGHKILEWVGFTKSKEG